MPSEIIVTKFVRIVSHVCFYTCQAAVNFCAKKSLIVHCRFSLFTVNEAFSPPRPPLLRFDQ